MPSPRSGRAKPALEYRDRKTTYAELRAGVDAVASGLMDLGVGPGTSVALYLPNTPYHPLSFFAALKAGGRHRAPLPARCRAGAGLQAAGTPARASWSPPTSASWLLLAQKLQARRPGRSSDRRRRHGLRPVGHPHHADRRMRRASCASTSSRADGAKQAAAAMADGERRGHRAAAVHRRHHRQAQGRHAHATPTSAPPARSTSSGAIRSASPSPARTRSSACCRCSTSSR